MTALEPPRLHDRARFPALDGLRGLAILLVLWHQQNALPAPFDVQETERLGASVDLFFARLGEAAWIGVDLFFVLSGFLITRSLLQTKSRPRYFGGYYARRALRVLPLYFAVLLVAFLVLPRIEHPLAAGLARTAGEAPMYWGLLQNLSLARADGFPGGMLDPTWSLALLVQFYLLWPIYVLVLDRFWLRWLSLLGILGAVLFRVLSGMDEVALFVLPFARMDALAAGVLVAGFEGDQEELDGLSAVATIARPVCYGGLGVLLVCGILLGGLAWTEPMMQGVGYSILALGLGAAVLLLLHAPEEAPAVRLLSSRPMRFLGQHSYALFLFHFPVLLVVREAFYGPGDFHAWHGSRLPGQLLFHLLCTSLTLVVALASWFLLDKHTRDLQRDHRPRERRRPVLGEDEVPEELIVLGDGEEQRAA